jgi:hypothetical protein
MSVVHELVIAYLILLYGSDTSSITHHRGHLCCLGSWGCTDIESSVSSLRCECEHRQHRCYGLEIYLSIIERASSLDGVFMDTIEHIDSVESFKILYDDSFFSELFEYLVTVSLQSIDAKRTFSCARKGIKNGIITLTEYGMQSLCEFFWKCFCHVILLRSKYLSMHP